jgi:uncharacterized membrane protein YgcG
MPWIIGGGALVALMLASKAATAPVPTVSRPVSHAAVAPAWRIRHTKNLWEWVNYFTGSNYTSSDAIPAAAYAATVRAACAHATPSDIPLLQVFARDMTSGVDIQGMTLAQGANYSKQVLARVAQMQRGATTVRRPTIRAIGITPHAPPHPSSYGGGPGYSYSPGSGSGGGGGGGFSPPSAPGGGGSPGGGSPGGNGSPPTDPQTGLPYNVAPPVDNSQLPYGGTDTSQYGAVGSTDSSGVTYGGEFG